MDFRVGFETLSFDISENIKIYEIIKLNLRRNKIDFIYSIVFFFFFRCRLIAKSKISALILFHVKYIRTWNSIISLIRTFFVRPCPMFHV